MTGSAPARIALDLLADLEAAHVRQPHVEHDQVDAAARATRRSASPPVSASTTVKPARVSQLTSR